MDKCREEFEEWFKTTQYFFDYFTDSDLNLNHRNEFENEIINSAWLTFRHQQAKVEELQVQLKGAQERAQLVLQYKDKYRLERDELQRQLSEYIFVAETLDEMYVKEVKSSEELQKRVGQQGLIIAKVMSIASDLQKSWSMFEIGKKLEQALKGEG